MESVGAMRNGEIDFVAIKDGEKTYIQVSYMVTEREVAPLISIPGGYSKLLIASTRQHEMQYEGIRIIDISDWLLEKDN